MDVQRSLSDIYNKCDLAHDTRSHLGAQKALQRAHRVRNARVCKKRNKGVHLSSNHSKSDISQTCEVCDGDLISATPSGLAQQLARVRPPPLHLGCAPLARYDHTSPLWLAVNTPFTPVRPSI